jgi:hypothetical protein
VGVGIIYAITLQHTKIRREFRTNGRVLLPQKRSAQRQYKTSFFDLGAFAENVPIFFSVPRVLCA